MVLYRQERYEPFSFLIACPTDSTLFYHREYAFGYILLYKEASLAAGQGLRRRLSYHTILHINRSSLCGFWNLISITSFMMFSRIWTTWLVTGLVLWVSSTNKVRSEVFGPLIWKWAQTIILFPGFPITKVCVELIIPNHVRSLSEKVLEILVDVSRWWTSLESSYSFCPMLSSFDILDCSPESHTLSRSLSRSITHIS